MELTVINLKKFPADLHQQAKIAAIKEGVTLRDWIIAAVREKLARIEETK